jgi:hypothetical protein
MMQSRDSKAKRREEGFSRMEDDTYQECNYQPAGASAANEAADALAGTSIYGSRVRNLAAATHNVDGWSNVAAQTPPSNGHGRMTRMDENFGYYNV